MKEYEFVTRSFLTKRTPVIIRIDGKGFSKFTRGFEKPFDKVLAHCMQQTTTRLCREIAEQLGRTASGVSSRVYKLGL